MKTYDFAVIGSGFVGLPTAYELAKEGHSVVLIDGNGLGAGASTGNTALLIYDGKTDSTTEAMCRNGISRYGALDDELDNPTGFEERGNLLLCGNEKENHMCASDEDFYHHLGLPYKKLDIKTAAEMEPNICFEEITDVWFRKEWIIDPMQTLYAWFAKARRLGMAWIESGNVVDFKREGNHISQVILSNGDSVSAGKFLVSAGAWTRDLLLKVGIDLPNYYIHGASLVMERRREPLIHNVINAIHGRRFDMERRGAEILRQTAFEEMKMINAMEGVFSPDIHGNLIIGQRSHVVKALTRDVPTNYLRDMSRWAVKLCPKLSDCRVVRSWISPVPFTHDEKPFFGYVRPFDNLAVSAGYGSVLIMAPSLGEIGADLLLERPVRYDVSDYDANRAGVKEVRCCE